MVKFSEEFFDLSLDLLCIANLEGYFLEINPQWEVTLGWSRSELCSKPFVEFVHIDDRAATAAAAADLSQGKRVIQFQNRYIRKNGSYCWLAWNALAILDKGLIYAVARDVTPIREQELLLAQLQSTAKIGGWKIHLTNMSTELTDEIYRILEIEGRQPISVERGVDFFELEFHAVILKLLREGIEEGKPWDLELPLTTAKGSKRWVRIIGRPALEGGRVTAILGTLQDVTERHASERIIIDQQRFLQQQKEQFDRLMANSPGMLYQFRMNPDGHMYLPFVSAQAFDIYELSPEDFKQDPSIMLRLADPHDQDGLRSAIAESAKTLGQFQWTGRIVTATGKQKWIKAKSVPHLEADGGILWDGIVIDITEEKLLERSLAEERAKGIHASKLATLGEMAAGVAHELSNPLAIISSAASYLEEQGDDSEKSKAKLLMIHRSVERISRIMRALRKFSRTSLPQNKKLISLSNIIQEGFLLTQAQTARYDVHIQSELTSDAQILCDEVEIEQVLVNLLTNAIDAVKGLEKRWIRVSTFDQNGRVFVHVTDSGPGISSEIREKIFEPFFTTKKVGEGTGLGMSIAKGIMEDHGGAIRVRHDLPHTCIELEFDSVKK